MARELVVRLIGDDDSLRRSFLRSSKAASDFDKSLTRSARGAIAATVSFRGMGRALAFGSNAFLGGAGAVFAVKAFSEAASNMAEQTSKANVVFGASTRIVQNFATNALGLARDEALQTASTFGALLKPLGLTGEAAAQTSVKLTQLGIDFASFFNTDITDALQAINSGLVGEVEPLRRYGVLLSQARVQQEALRESGKKSVKQLTNQEIVQARIALIFRDSAQAQGDFARTQGGLANQQRILAQNIRNLEISLGQALNPAILDVTKSLNKWLSDTFNQQRLTHDLEAAVSGATTAVRLFSDGMKVVDKVTGSLANTLEILVGLKAASVFSKWANEMGLFAKAEKAASEAAIVSKINAYAGGVEAVGTAAVIADGRLATLRARLASISAARFLIPVTIAITAEQVGNALGENTDFSPGRLFGDAKRLFSGHIDKGPLLNFILGNGWQSDLQKSAQQATAGFTTDPAIQNVGRVTFKNLRKAINDAIDKAAAADTGGGGGGGRRGLTPDQLNTFFDNARSRILLRGGLGSISQQIASLQRADSLIRERIAVTKDVTRRLNLEDQLLRNEAQIRQLQAQQAADAAQKASDARDKALTALTARQFRQLGLTATGDQPVPLVPNLKKQLASLTERIDGTRFDTPRLNAQLKRIRKVLSEGFVPQDVRSKIASMFDDIRSTLKQETDKTTRQLTQNHRVSPNAILAGLGLTADQIRSLRGRLAALGPGGTFGAGSLAFAGAGTTVVHTTITLDGQTVAKNTTTHQRRQQRRRSDSRRGPYAGRN